MTKVTVFDTKPYDRSVLETAAQGRDIELNFVQARLNTNTAAIAAGSHAVCLFVNDHADKEALEALATFGVRHLALRCAGFNNVDLETAKVLGMAVTRVPAYSPYAVAEHALALLLCLNRKIHRAHHRVRELDFSLHGLVGFDLHGKTAGLYGTGKIGRVTGQILRGFGMRVLAYDPYPDPAWAVSHGIEYTDIEALLRHSDVLSLHAPLTPETRHFINEERLAQMKSSAVIVNVSRGALIETKALIRALKSGKLGGVALDVYEEEEGVFFEDLSEQGLNDDVLARLLTFPNVLITAHQAFLTDKALGEIARVTTENISRLSCGQAALEGTTL